MALKASAPQQALQPSPTSVVRELVASRTADSSTYLLSDGSLRQELSAGPVHYKDGDGVWKDIDASLVPEGFGLSGTKSSAYNETFASDDVTDTPVSISNGAWSLGMDLIGGEQSQMLALGATASYPLAMTDTQLTYETSNLGVKETLVLSSPKAPSTFTFFVSTKNLSLYATPGGDGYALYDDGSGKQAAAIAPLQVYDKAGKTEGSPSAVCASATMSVKPAPGGAYVTYDVPRAWLDDPARTYPVYVDPQIVYGGSNVWTDTYVCSGYAGSTFCTPDHLDIGWVGAQKTSRSLIRFNMDEIPVGATINSATLKLYCYTNTTAGSKTVFIKRVTGSTNQGGEPWTKDSTWNTTFSSNQLLYDSAASTAITGTGSKTWTCTSMVQSWYDGSMPNKGFIVWDNADGTSADTYRQFRSAQYTADSSKTPQLTVDYTVPTISGGSFDKASYKPGDTVTMTVRESTKDPAGATGVQAAIQRANQQGDDPCPFIWTTYDIDPYGWNGYQKVQAGPNSWFSCLNIAGDSVLTPDLDACSTTTDSGTRIVNFVFKVGQSWGDVQNNHLWATTYDGDGTWADTGAAFSVLPAATVPASTATTASAGWWDASAGNDDTATAGRGSVKLTWPLVPAASGYTVYLFDGNQYQSVGTTTATSWSSAGLRLYPSDSAIASLAAGYLGNPFSSSGLDLRDDPRPLYAKTAGTAFDSMPAYALKIVPYNSGGSSLVSDNTTIAVNLDARTTHANDDAQHTSVDVGDIAGQSVEVLADNGTLQMSATDLDIDSYGPGAALSRSYDSADTTSRDFGGPGWRFAYEQSVVATTSGAVTYYDESGGGHRFTHDGTKWVAPVGDFDTLSGDSNSGWTLTLKDQTVLTFGSGTEAKITSERDTNSNTTTYSKDPATGDVTITAANGKTITIDLLGGGDARATYSADGVNTRQVDYHYGASADGHTATATVTYSFAGTPATAGHSVDYLYTDSRLTGVRVNTPDKLANQPTASAAWDFGWIGNRLTSLVAPYYDAAQRASTAIAYDTDASGLARATVTRSGKVTNSDADVSETYGINRTGTLAYKTNPKVAAETTATWTYTYSVTAEQASETNPDLGVKSSTIDARGNVVAERDELGRQTLSVYDSLDRPLTTTDPRGSVTSNSYDANGNLSTTTKTLNAAGDVARSEYSYDSRGRKTLERHKLSEDTSSKISHWLTTTYAYDQGIEEPSAQTQKGQWRYSTDAPGTYTDEPIDLGGGNTKTSLVTVDAHDAWGDKTAHSDARSKTTETDSYDLAGRMVSSTDIARVTSHHVYDALGNETASWQSAPRVSDGAAISANYRETCVDPFGRTVRESMFRTNGDTGTKVADRVIDNTFDAMGRETGAHDSFAGGQDALSYYDARGNVTTSWPGGVPAYDSNRATTAAFDKEGRTYLESSPGTITANTTTVYNVDGTVKTVTGADGTVTSDSYDVLTGDKVSETDGSGTTKYAYDLAGRLVSEADGAGSTTSYGYDLADRQVKAVGDAPDGSASTTTYNALGWVLLRTDADAIPTVDAYDENGRLVSEQVGDNPATTSSFDDAGRIVSQHSDDGTVTSSYDEFGRTKSEVHVTDAGTVKDVSSVYDSLGRLTASADNMSGETSGYQYATGAGQNTTSSVTYGGVTTTTTVDAAGNELSRDTSIPLVGVLSRHVSTDPGGRVASWTFADGLAGQNLFDAGGRLFRQWGLGFSASAATTDAYSFEDVTGRKVRDNLQLSFGGTIAATYGYTADGRLATVTASAPASFTYDSAGNVTTFTANVVGSTTPTSGVLHYDANNRMTSKTTTSGGPTLEVYTFDTSGRRTTQGPPANPRSIVASYTGSGRLASWDTSAGIHATYAYDALGQRTGSVVTSGTGGSAVTTETAYTYSGLTLLSLSSTRTVGATSTTFSISYLYGGDGRAYGGVYRAGSATPAVFGVVTTDRGDVVSLTDTSGAPFAAYRYDAWGRPLSTSTQATGSVTASAAADIASRQPLRYAGYVYDAESQTYYLSARTYDPATMQFLQKDPAKADGEESTYQYCGGDPASRIDPCGQKNIKFKYFGPSSSVVVLDDYLPDVLSLDAAYAEHQWGTYASSIPLLPYLRRLIWWAHAEGGGKMWDFKLDLYSKNTYQFHGTKFRYDDIGNIHYGFAGRAYGLSEGVLLRGAGIANFYDKVKWALKVHKLPQAWARLVKALGTELAWYRSNLDDPQDQSMIRYGWNLYPSVEKWAYNGFYYYR